MAPEYHFVYDTNASDEVARVIYAEITTAIERGLSRLGIEAVFEDSHGVLALRVADERNLGTAYLELRHCGMRMRIVLFEEHAGSEPDTRTVGAKSAIPAA